jgi:hypothetical protein
MEKFSNQMNTTLNVNFGVQSLLPSQKLGEGHSENSVLHIWKAHLNVKSGNSTIKHKEKYGLLSLTFLKQNIVNIKSAKISIIKSLKMKPKYECKISSSSTLFS